MIVFKPVNDLFFLRLCQCCIVVGFVLTLFAGGCFWHWYDVLEIFPCKVRLWLLWLWNQHGFIFCRRWCWRPRPFSHLASACPSLALLLLHLYLSWVPSLCFLVVFQVQDTSSSFGNNAMSGTQVAALFIGMETERGYRRRAWKSVREREEACQA